ncbi:hypothetical protein ACFFWE_11280 [Sphaerisporangium melleum]|uniref:hypothetical protein n=1 Tax=Sphaerisporangium melleum TaxID=321316 RepID=UPI0027DCF04C|nr:hypothetical protein [Sphaerisporangium melleum]
MGVGGAAFSGALWGEAFGAVAQPGPSPYGPLQAADGNGIQLPAGFTSRVIARSGRQVAGYTWHWAPDGGACFPDGTGWIYVSNSRDPAGGRRLGGALRRRRHHRVRVPHPVGYQPQLRRRRHTVGHLAVV